jgi:hypothetical protein
LVSFVSSGTLQNKKGLFQLEHWSLLSHLEHCKTKKACFNWNIGPLCPYNLSMNYLL